MALGKAVHILIEGLDGSGKTSLCRALVGAWPSPHVKLLSFPSHTGEVGKLIRRVFVGDAQVRKPAMMSLMLADAVDFEPVIAAAITAGTSVICDRHSLVSAFVYQTENHPHTDVADAVRMARFKPPDCVFLLDVQPDVALERRARRGEARNVLYEPAPEDVARLRAQRAAYFERVGALRFRGTPSVVLDGARPVPENVENILAIIGGEHA